MRADVLVEVLERFKKGRQQQFANVEGNEHTSTFKDPKKRLEFMEYNVTIDHQSLHDTSTSPCHLIN